MRDRFNPARDAHHSIDRLGNTVVKRSVWRPVFLSALFFPLGCAPESPIIVRTDEPMVYVILTPDSLISPLPELHGLLANTGTPVTVEYLTADRFVMRRVSDGAIFDWQLDTSPQPSSVPFGGNYVLAESANSRGLGRRDLEAGERYTLEVSISDRTITGRVTIPSHPAPHLVVKSNGVRVVEWPRIAAAGEYRLDIESEFPRNYATRDTFFVLKDAPPGGQWPAHPQFSITAIDTNWYRYSRDNTAVRAGVQGGFGVFGAMSASSIEIPRPGSP